MITSTSPISREKLRIRLAAAKGFDSPPIVSALIANIDPENAAFGEIGAPHAQGVSAFSRILIPAYANFEKVDPLAADFTKQILIVLCIPVSVPLVSSINGRKHLQIGAEEDFTRQIDEPAEPSNLKLQKTVLDPLPFRIWPPAVSFNNQRS